MHSTRQKPGISRPPQSLQSFRDTLKSEHTSLSPRLQEVASYLNHYPQSVAVDTLNAIADKAQVPPSTLIRFANHFGFKGFSELQRLYKDDVHQNYQDYSQRIQQLHAEAPSSSELTPSLLLQEFSQANRQALEHLPQLIDNTSLDNAVDLMDSADRIFICGIRRAFPVAYYLMYTLRQVGAMSHIIDGTGMMFEEQAGTITSDDALIAITYKPWSKITQSVVSQAASHQAATILITDSTACHSAATATCTLITNDADHRDFRSLSSSLCLAQALCIGLGIRREVDEHNKGHL